MYTTEEFFGATNIIYVCSRYGDRGALTHVKEVFGQDGVLGNVTQRLGLDIETYPVNRVGLDYEFCTKRAKMRSIQISNGTSSVVFDLDDMCEEAVAILKNFIATHKFFIHNALFDLRFLQEWGVPFVNAICTLVTYSLVLKSRYPDSKKYSTSLKEVTRQLYHIDISKHEQRSDWGASYLTRQQINYAAYDAYLVYRIGNDLLKDKAIRTENFKINTRVLNALARIIRAGVYIDTDRLDVMIASWKEEAVKAEEECKKYYGDLNIRSNVQLGAWLKEHLTESEYEAWDKTPKGSLKTDANTLIAHEEIPALKPLVRYKKFQKYISTYGESIKKMINPVTNRLHPSYTVAYTESGRLSSMHPNIQNFPRPSDDVGNYRELFKHQFDNSVMVCADYSQVEVRVAAILSHETKMLEAYRTGKDLYKQTASLLLHKPEEEITKAERQRAKAVVLGLQFGMGAAKLSLYAKQYGVELSDSESKTLVENYRLAYPNLYAWQKETTNSAALTLTAMTVGGMIRCLSPDNYYTCSLNTPVQGSAAEAILYAIELLDREFVVNKIPAKIVATVHDEILVECRKDRADEVKDLLEQAMGLGFQHVFPENFGAINNIVEAHVGSTWFDAK